jgi:hypothetical protein
VLPITKAEKTIALYKEFHDKRDEAVKNRSGVARASYNRSRIKPNF